MTKSHNGWMRDHQTVCVQTVLTSSIVIQAVWLSVSAHFQATECNFLHKPGAQSLDEVVQSNHSNIDRENYL